MCCIHCGQMLTEGDRFCSSCGAPSEQGQPTTPYEPERRYTDLRFINNRHLNPHLLHHAHTRVLRILCRPSL